MIELNPNKRISAVDALKHRFVSYMLVNEPDLPTRYLDEEKVVPQLEDNFLYPIEEYRTRIHENIIEKVLKQRRFQQKEKQIAKELQRERKRKEIERRNRKRRQGTSQFNNPGKSLQEEDEEEDMEDISNSREVNIKQKLRLNKDESDEIDEFHYPQN